MTQRINLEEQTNEQSRLIIELKRRVCELENENNSLVNTVNEYSQYKQRCYNLENDNFALKIKVQNLIGLKDALNKRIVEIEDQNDILRTELNNKRKDI